MTSVSDVIEAFRSGPPGYGEAYPLLFGLAEERPDDLPVLARQVLEELPAGSKLTRAVLPWLDMDDLVTLADRAVTALGRPGRPRDAAAAVVDGVSLQVPGALSRHLPGLWELDEGAYFYSSLGSEAWWCGADLAEVRRLAGIMAAGSEDERFRAWSCLLESRTAEGWAEAWEHRNVAADLDPAVREIFWWSVGLDASSADDAGATASAAGTGTSAGPPLRSLVTAPAYHLHIPPEALAAPLPQPWYTRWHPTWGLSGRRDLESGQAVMGGVSGGECPDGHGPLRRLLLLDPPPPGCAADGRARLDLGYCFDCGTPAFYGHDADGRPRRLGPDTRGRHANPFEADDVRPAVTVPLMQLPRWQRQNYMLAWGRENLNRIGGEPTWIQDPDYPACPSCAAPMPSLAQLHWLDVIGAGEGITYIFWCEPCAISAIDYQST
jgi:hypothetical protein